ncbi:thermonuclease family protein [Microbacterium sp. NPDC019599]|uniref:thermonuclease family protein n=1 Tax=Microbacterium sp. NPDC019599 TaxID=3154690 RepID=UPI0033FBAE1E
MRIGARVIVGAAIVGAVVLAVWWFGVRPLATAETDQPSAGAPARPDDAFAMTVVSVWDGDTLRATTTASDSIPTSDDVRVRLIGIDTPEVSSPAECWAEEARLHLTDLAPVGATVWAAFDEDPQDRYDRYLLYLWTDDGRFINDALVAAGDAETMTVEPNDEHAALFAASEARAREAGAGQWGACG